MYTHGITRSLADWWIHIFPLECRLYAYRRTEMLDYIKDIQPRHVHARRETGEGYLVPRDAPFILHRQIPQQLQDRQDMTDAEFGKYGETLVGQLLQDGFLFPMLKGTWHKGSWNWEKWSVDYISGSDRAPRLTIEIKTEQHDTGNLFVQTAELHHDPHLTPNGARRWTA